MKSFMYLFQTQKLVPRMLGLDKFNLYIYIYIYLYQHLYCYKMPFHFYTTKSTGISVVSYVSVTITTGLAYLLKKA
jgi:hypothetical protein